MRCGVPTSCGFVLERVRGPGRGRTRLVSWLSTAEAEAQDLAWLAVAPAPPERWRPQQPAQTEAWLGRVAGRLGPRACNGTCPARLQEVRLRPAQPGRPAGPDGQRPAGKGRAGKGSQVQTCDRAPAGSSQAPGLWPVACATCDATTRATSVHATCMPGAALHTRVHATRTPGPRCTRDAHAGGCDAEA